MLDVVHLVPEVEERLKGAAGLLEHGATRMGEAVLREVADRQVRRRDNRARVGFLVSGQHPEQCCLAGAVGAAEADTVAVADLPRHTIEQNPITKRFCEVGKLDQLRGGGAEGFSGRGQHVGNAERLQQVARHAEVHRFDGARLG